MVDCQGGRSAKFGVAIFKVSMLDLGGRSAMLSANMSSYISSDSV